MTITSASKVNMISQTFRYPDGVTPNVCALAFTVLGYPLGIALLVTPFLICNLLGFALVVITLVWSAYFIHECAHQAIFKSAGANARWGSLMSWINGSCYAHFDSLRRKHMRHHVERADVITFDARGALLRAPAWQRNTVLALEWAYFPAVEFLMRSFVVLKPFHAGGSAAARGRILGIAVLRSAGWIALGMVSLKALSFYFFAYVTFITLLRFADCFQHTYDAYAILDDTAIPADKVRDRAYEQDNTFTDIVGMAHPWLNMLWLNFGFHNAHHARPTMPWHRLPSYHRELYADDHVQVIEVRELLRSFHINRVKRVLSADCGQVRPTGSAGRADDFVGAVGVSFLTAV
ncbi:MAG: fatty acid desaturase [Janthinobacterium sp.]|jgi:fatty acid desaturase